MFITTDGFKFEKVSSAVDATVATEMQLVAGDGCFVEYSDQTLVSRKDDFLGDIEASFDGNSVLVQTMPSSCNPHDAFAARIEKKFKIARKQTTLFAYMLYANLGGDDVDVRRHYEKQIAERGFPEIFSEVKTLFFAMLELEPSDEIRAFLGEGAEFRALPVDSDKFDQEHPDHELSGRQKQASDLYSSVVDKVRHLNKKNISDAGKKLYQWAQKPDIRALLGFESIKSIWADYNKRKQELASL